MSATRIYRYKCYIDGCSVYKTERRDLIMHFNTNQHPGDTWDVNNVGEPVLCERGLNNRYTPISTTTTAATSSSNELEDRIEELEQGVAEAAELLAKGAEALKDLLEKVEKLKRENRTLRQGGEEK